MKLKTFFLSINGDCDFTTSVKDMLRSNFTVRKFQRDLVCWFLSCLIIWKHYFQTIFLRYNLHLHDDSILLSFVHVSDFLCTIWSYTPPCTLKYLHFINAYDFCGHSIYFSCCFRLLNGIGYTIYLKLFPPACQFPYSYYIKKGFQHIRFTENLTCKWNSISYTGRP